VCYTKLLRYCGSSEPKNGPAESSPAGDIHDSLLPSAADVVIRFRKGNVSILTAHEFFKGPADGMPETSLVKTILHMLAYPLEKCLAKNLQFFSAYRSRLSAEPLQLRWGQTIRDRRVNLIGFFVP
jgi:hypothetical protein